MKFGACAGDLSRYVASVNAGCDFVEFAARDLSLRSKDEILEIRRYIDEYGVPLEAANCLFPGEILLTGKDRSLDVINEYTKSLFDKAGFLGIKVVVFGSGAARSVPEGEGREECLERFYSTVYLTCENAEKNGIEVALEPLRKVECNLFNTVKEGVEICKAVNHSSLGVNPDLFHMYNENEPFENLEKYVEYIKHIHIGDYTRRRYPSVGDGCEYAKIFEILKNAGYNGRISIESGTDDYENDCRNALEILRNI